MSIVMMAEARAGLSFHPHATTCRLSWCLIRTQANPLKPAKAPQMRKLLEAKAFWKQFAP